ncbi:Carbohydrate sulfotransferase 15 [Holothuria leucospilota]|uniref:Carbohydrate sulfotransferase 15 n=1 Tax=Holothuria leucospilota TaxID=206669 RepID=A0A9Q1CAQ8_HOLLE|nr:Carbohydrate sulfotransferase 15 [Holothuria leucospilota]
MMTFIVKNYLSPFQVFKRVPTNYLDNYRNPCWMEEGNLLCLPYFYVIGFHKCGTSDVFGRVERHPNVLKVLKEPHWWSIKRIQKSEFCDSVVTYIYYFPHFIQVTDNDDYDDDDVGLGHLPVVPCDLRPCPSPWNRDGSVSTIARVIYTQWKWDEDPDSLPYLMHALQPKAKIIITVRDPVSR